MTENTATRVHFARPAATNDAEWADLSTRLIDAAAARVVPMAALAPKCPEWCDSSDLHLGEALDPGCEGYFHLRTVISEPGARLELQEYQHFQGNTDRGVHIIELHEELEVDQVVRLAAALAAAAATLTGVKA
jgi:hypothetical protein